MDHKWRVFLSYRGESTSDPRGKKFAEEFYNFLNNDPACIHKYGEIYFSPKSDEYGNFKTPLPVIMESVEFFIIPLTQDFFNGFWDEKRECPNKNSVTYKEIRAAIDKNNKIDKNNSNSCKTEFICLTFPGYNEKNTNELCEKIFGNKDSEYITGAKKHEYDESRKIQIFREISDHIVSNVYQEKGAFDLIHGGVFNIQLQTKRETENPAKYPFYQEIQDVKRISLLNYASTSFLSGVEIASFYEESDDLIRWFRHHLRNGDIEVNIVLTDPFCYAAKDAASFKMYPANRNDDVKKEQIILKNIMELYGFRKEFPKSGVKLFLTKIALPYGIMMTEHKNNKNNHMKVDIYSAVTGDDAKRPSFYMLENDDNTRVMYDFFRDNFNNIMNNHARRYDFSNSMSCFINKDKPIIHRGVLNSECLPHTELSFLQCIDRGLPMEVDLLQIQFEEIIVGRDDFDLNRFGIEKKLSECTSYDITNINRRAGANRLLYLKDFLNLVGGRVPVIFEIKLPYNRELSQQEEEYINMILSEIEEYLLLFSNVAEAFVSGDSYPVAIHSSNPYVIEFIKHKNCMIPCGIIMTDFSKYKDASPEYSELHKTSDFISYDVSELESESFAMLKEKYKKPILAWTIKDKEAKEYANEFCDNVIQEGIY